MVPSCLLFLHINYCIYQGDLAKEMIIESSVCLISWIKFAVCYRKGNQCCNKFSDSCLWHSLHMLLQNWKRSLWELYLDLPRAKGRTYERKSHQNCSSLSDFYTHHLMPAKSGTWKWQSTYSFNVYKVFCNATCSSQCSWQELTLMENQQIGVAQRGTWFLCKEGALSTRKNGI